jgi:hypothetical protein
VISLEDCLILNPIIRLRNDKYRVILYNTDPTESGTSSFTAFLSPRDAALLALFTGDISTVDIIKLWAESTFQNTKEATLEAVRIFENLLTLDTEILVPSNGNASSRTHYNIAQICELEHPIDVGTKRCYIPIGFTHEICYKCTTNCIYCYSGLPNRIGELLSIERIREIASEANSLRMSEISLSGGDPFCHPDILQILQIYTDASLRVDVAT